MKWFSGTQGWTLDLQLLSFVISELIKEDHDNKKVISTSFSLQDEICLVLQGCDRSATRHNRPDTIFQD
jgi:hypothetical protein